MKTLEKDRKHLERETNESPMHSKYQQSLIAPLVLLPFKENLLTALKRLQCPHLSPIEGIMIADSANHIFMCKLDRTRKKPTFPMAKYFSVEDFVEFLIYEAENERKTTELDYDELKSKIKAAFEEELAHRKESIGHLLGEFMNLLDELVCTPADEFLRAAHRDAFMELESLTLGVIRFAKNYYQKEVYGSPVERVSLEQVKNLLKANKNSRIEQFIGEIYGFFKLISAEDTPIELFGNLRNAENAEKLINYSQAKEYLLSLDKMIKMANENQTVNEICQECQILVAYLNNSARTPKLRLNLEEKNLSGVKLESIENFLSSWEFEELLKNVGNYRNSILSIHVGHPVIVSGLSRTIEASKLQEVIFKPM